MARELLSSKVVLTEEEPRVRGIATGPTSVAGLVGITERGPLGVPVLCTEFPEYEEVFGGFTTTGSAALAALGFFENGGSSLWVVRTCHYNDVSRPVTATARASSGDLMAAGGPAPASVEGLFAEPLDVGDGDRIYLRVAGIDVEIAIDAEPARARGAAVEPFALSDGGTLEVTIGTRSQLLTFDDAEFVDIAAATGAEVAAALNAQLVGARAGVAAGAVFIEGDARGHGAVVEVVGGAAATALGMIAGAVHGTGNVEFAGAVRIAEIEAELAALTPDVVATSTEDGRLRLATAARGAAAELLIDPATAEGFGLAPGLYTGEDHAPIALLQLVAADPGTWGDRLTVEIRAAASGKPSAFDLAVFDGTVERETFRELTLDPASVRFVVAVVNDARTGSRLVRLAVRPGVDAAPLALQRQPLAGGNDGLELLADVDFIGAEAANPGEGGALGAVATGLHALDRVLEASILLSPDRATPAMHDAMLRYCEVDRDGLMFAVLDAPAGLRATQIVTYVESNGLEGTSEHGAIYWPRLRIPNPRSAVFGSATDVVAPPSGVIAGVYARTDAARLGGIYDPPAGIEAGRMFGVLGFENDEVLEEKKRDLIYPHRINPLTSGPGLPRFIDGSRTLNGAGKFPFVASRRGVSHIERALKRSLEFVRHKNPTDSLLAQVDRSVRAFLVEQTGLDAFASRDPDLAFQLTVSQRLIAVPGGVASRVLVQAGLARSSPAEFVVISVSQDTRAIERALTDTL